MPRLDAHDPSTFVKGLYLGNPGAGKTGSLDSLVGAGYRLYFYDFDNLLRPLISAIQHNNPDKMGNVLVQTFTDEIEIPAAIASMNGQQMRINPFTKGHPKAYQNALKQLTKWNTPEDGDLGDPGKFGHDSIVVLDSLTQMSLCAYRYCQAFNPAAKEGQTHYFNAQQLVLNCISKLFSEQFATNVLVLAHVNYRENEFEIVKGFPRSIGSALNDQIGGFFNTILLAEVQGQGAGLRRVIRTKSNGIVDLKNPAHFDVPEIVPLESGLATIFEAITNRRPGDATSLKLIKGA